MKKIALSAIIFIFLFTSCKEYKNAISANLAENDLPVEIVIYEGSSDKDSLMIGISIPKKLDIKNELDSDRVLKAITFGYKDANLNKKNLGNKVFLIQDGERKFLKYHKILKGEKKSSDIYITYKVLVPALKKNELINKGTLVNNNKYNQKIFTIGSIEKNQEFLNETISQNKGFIKLHIIKPEETKSDIKFIPVTF